MELNHLSLTYTGLWRLESLRYGLKYASCDEDKLAIVRGLLGVKQEYTLSTPYGVFHCPDFASAYQFRPSWEREVKRIISNLRYSLFVDAGANIGFYSVMAAKSGNHVIAIEPNQNNFMCLMENIQTNHVAGPVEYANCALSNTNSKGRLRVGKYGDTSRLTSDQGYEIDTRTLDFILQGREADLIKLDIEGSESKALEGLSSSPKRIIFEALTPSKFEACRKRLPNYSIRQLDATNFLAEVH